MKILIKATVLFVLVAGVSSNARAQTYHPTNMGPVIQGNTQTQRLIAQQAVNRAVLRAALRRRANNAGVSSSATRHRGASGYHSNHGRRTVRHTATRAHFAHSRR